MMKQLFTIGVYGFDDGGFFGALNTVAVDLFLDVRRRRGLRGQLYSFANATRLQDELAARGIVYRHAIELAPEPETRELQDRQDREDHMAKRQRESLSEAFVEDYVHRTLAPFDWDVLVTQLAEFDRPVLFCVERLPQACHRRLAAERLAAAAKVPVTHLIP